jgi:hypothetical protein
MKSMFADHVDKMRILMTIRNQPDLIFSLYCQHYSNLFTDSEKFDSWNSYYNELLTTDEINSIFFFNDLIEEYRNSFGEDNVSVMLFEDLKYDKSKIVSEIAQQLALEEDISEIVSLDEKHNESRKTDEQYIVRDPEPSAIGKLFSSQIGTLAKSTVKRILLMVASRGVTNRVKTVYTNLHWSELDTSIDKPPSEQKEKIVDKYRENNMKLCQSANIDESRFREYRYI